MRKQRHLLHRRPSLILVLFCLTAGWSACLNKKAGTPPYTLLQVTSSPDTLLSTSGNQKIAEWVLGTNFIPLRQGFAVTVPYKSLLQIYDPQAHLKSTWFIGRDTVLRQDDPYIKTLGMQSYHDPDALVWMDRVNDNEECIGLLSGQRLYTITTDGKCLGKLGLDTEWSQQDLAFEIKNESRIAYWPSSRQLCVTITPSDYFNRGDRPHHFTQDSLFFTYQLPPVQPLTFIKITPSRLWGQYGPEYPPDKPLPHLDRRDWYGDTYTYCLSAAASPTVKVYTHSGTHLTSFGQPGKQIQDIPLTPLTFDTLANKRYRRHQYDRARYTSPEYTYASYQPSIGLAFRAYREGTDSTTANLSFQDRWDHRPQWLQIYRLKTNQVLELPLPPHQRILYISQSKVYTISKSGHLIAYHLNPKALRKAL